jgi:hypothetical protein
MITANFQAKALAHDIRPDFLAETMTSALLENAERNLRTFDFIGICEYFGDSVRVLSETLGVELSAKKLNVNPDRRFAAPTAEELASRDSSMGWTSNDTTRAGRALSAFIQVAALQACCVPRQVTRSAAASNIRPDAGVSWAERLLTDCNYGCGDRGYRNSYREGHPRPKARRLNSAGFLRALNIPSVEPPHHPPRSRFGPRADQLSNAFTSASSSLP